MEAWRTCLIWLRYLNLAGPSASCCCPTCWRLAVHVMSLINQSCPEPRRLELSQGMVIVQGSSALCCETLLSACYDMHAMYTNETSFQHDCLFSVCKLVQTRDLPPSCLPTRSPTPPSLLLSAEPSHQSTQSHQSDSASQDCLPYLGGAA